MIQTRSARMNFLCDPLDLHVLAGYKPTPQSFDTAHRFLDYLTNLVEVGVLEKKNMVHLELDSAA